MFQLTTIARVAGAARGGGVVVVRHCFGGYVDADIQLIVISDELETCMVGRILLEWSWRVEMGRLWRVGL
jgi:hypothetical protein